MIGLSLPPGDLHVLCLGAHPDDIEIGCGGTLLALGERAGVQVTALVLTGTEQRVRESAEALSLFAPRIRLETAGLADGHLPAHWDETKTVLEALARRCQPDLIFAPRADDAHQDHRLIARLAPTTWRDTLILHYEIPKWDGDLGAASHYVPLSEVQAKEKVAVLNRCFASQAGRDWWDDEVFLGLMRLRGVQCRSRYAEAFTSAKLCLEVSASVSS
jgi:LmbE family N-acetylglucosaminyl deacetylase